jgi:hypothetical protein
MAAKTKRIRTMKHLAGRLKRIAGQDNPFSAPEEPGLNWRGLALSCKNA